MQQPCKEIPQKGFNVYKLLAFTLWCSNSSFNDITIVLLERVTWFNSVPGQGSTEKWFS